MYARDRVFLGTADLVSTKHLLEVGGAVRLWTFQRHAQSTVPDQLSSNTQGTRDTKEDGVVVLFLQAIVLEQDTRVGVDVGPRVLGLAVFSKNTRLNNKKQNESMDRSLSKPHVYTYHNVIQFGDQLEERVFGQVLEGKFTLSSVARVGLAEDCVTITRHNLTAVQSVPEVLLDLFFRRVEANRVLELQGPAQHFLVGKTVQRTSQTVQTSGKGKVRVRKSRTDQVGPIQKQNKRSCWFSVSLFLF